MDDGQGKKKTLGKEEGKAKEKKKIMKEKNGRGRVKKWLIMCRE